MRAKFDGLAIPVIGPARALALTDQGMALEKVRNVSELMKLTTARCVLVPLDHAAARNSAPHY